MDALEMYRTRQRELFYTIGSLTTMLTEPRLFYATKVNEVLDAERMRLIRMAKFVGKRIAVLENLF